jgi:hypothetical protein
LIAKTSPPRRIDRAVAAFHTMSFAPTARHAAG